MARDRHGLRPVCYPVLHVYRAPPFHCYMLMPPIYGIEARNFASPPRAGRGQIIAPPPPRRNDDYYFAHDSTAMQTPPPRRYFAILEFRVFRRFCRFRDAEEVIEGSSRAGIGMPR